MPYRVLTNSNFHAMNEQFIVNGYHITTDPTFQDQKFGISPKLRRQMESLFYEINDNKNKRIIEELTQLIIENPTVPILKNYLSVAYNARGNYQKALEANNWLATEHPDYLFARLNQAHACINDHQYEKVPEILGEALEIKQLYPERDIFHLVEITSFYKLTVRYFVAIENYELAENRLELMKDIAPKHHDTEEAERYLFAFRLKNSAKRWEEENKQRITPHNSKSAPSIVKENTPLFNHPEIKNLYQYGLRIPHQLLRDILALPRKTVVEDLERILTDAIDRYEYFSNKEYHEEKQSFVIHALFLLNELKSEESLPKILSFLEYQHDVVHFWIGLHQTETLWQCLYGLGAENCSLLKQFLMKPGIDTYCKTPGSQALCQIALHQPQKRNEIAAIYQEIFTLFLETSADGNLLDTDFLGFAIGNTIYCGFQELLPIIKKLYDKGYVSTSINGNYASVVKDFTKPPRPYHQRKILNIFNLYDKLISSWFGYNEEKEINYSQPSIKPQQGISVKINRNDLCPCGSGKKYKKCCGN